MKQITNASKKILVLAFTLLNLIAAPAFAAGTIDGWEETLPVSQEETTVQIDTKVADLTFKDEEIYMGGQAWDYKLVDVYTDEDHDGAVTYNLRVQYRASMTLDWGQTETTRVCQSLIVVDPKLNMNVGEIECPDMPEGATAL